MNVKRTFFCLTIISLIITFNVSGQNAIALNLETFQKDIRLNSSIQLIDLRSPLDYSDGHIKRALSFDYAKVDFEDTFSETVKKDQAVYLYSFTSTKAKNAATYLKDIGFEEVYFLEGGFSTWTASSKPYVSSRSNTQPIASFTVDNLISTINYYPSVFLFLHSKTCKYCKVMEPIVRNNTGGTTGIKMLKIDADKDLEITELLKANDTPTMVLYRNGKQVWRFSGEIQEAKLQEVLLNF